MCWSSNQIFFTGIFFWKDSINFIHSKMTLKLRILRSLTRLFIILVSLTRSLFSEKTLISNRCISGLMSNLIKKSWTVSNAGVIQTNFTQFGSLLPLELTIVDNLLSTQYLTYLPTSSFPCSCVQFACDIKVYYFSEKLRGMREHLCLKVKALEHTVRISDTSLGFSDLLMNADNKG